ncbi:MAG: toxin regulator PfoR [Gammaproteobacteria bacterium]|nr:MAG: toxin regulator PfoR [Gammaproteobacteria bacterium]
MNPLKQFAKRYVIDAMTGMALGLFVTLIAGLIMMQIGRWLDFTFMINVGRMGIVLMGAGIGVGIAWYLKAPPLVMLSCLVAGLMGAHSQALIDGSYFIEGGMIAKPGNPVSAYLCAVIAYRVTMLIAGKTSFDILLVPMTVMLSAYATCVWLCPPIATAVSQFNELIHTATTLQPLLMGVVIAVVVGILLTLPTSSAAICIAIGLDGIAGGAAVVGCAAQMVGFGVASYRDNGFGGLVAQGLGTSMLQIPNVFKKPIIMLPAIVASIVVGPLATVVFQLQCISTGAGMGTAGLVGVFGVLDASETVLNPVLLWSGIALLMFVLPAGIAWGVSEAMRKKGYLQAGDMKLPTAK